MQLIWQPGIAVGPFYFDHPRQEYEQDFNLEYYELEGSDRTTYEIRDLDLDLLFEKDLIVTISCRRELLYKDRNLIGMTLDQLMTIIQLPKHDVYERYDIELGDFHVYSFFPVGLQAWLLEGRVNTILVNNAR